MSLWGDDSYTPPLPIEHISRRRAPAPPVPAAPRQQFAPPPAPGFMSAFGSMGSSAPAASVAAADSDQPPGGLPAGRSLQVLLRDKTTGMFYGKKDGRNVVSLSDPAYFDGFSYHFHWGVERFSISPDQLAPAPGGVLVGGKRRKSRRSTRRKSRR